MQHAVTEILVNIDVADIETAERFYCAAFELIPGRRFGGGAVSLRGSRHCGADPRLLEAVSVRLFDGTDTWAFHDRALAA